MRIVRPVILVDYEEWHDAYIFLQPTQHVAVFNVFTARLKARYIYWWSLTPCLFGICIDLEDRSSKLLRNMSNYLTRDPFAVFNIFTARLKARYIYWWRLTPCLVGICIDIEDRSSKLLRNMSNYLTRDPFPDSSRLEYSSVFRTVLRCSEHARGDVM